MEFPSPIFKHFITINKPLYHETHAFLSEHYMPYAGILCGWPR